ncbi:hypothetical protein CYMTET_34332 [Cymbomonas tetramitiformis]|uniref:Uncharacterized protein n=1 Tax=Cymbomonas tetramitiformis TaxID=36881 RepID=A0AAE0FB99_9CHLO|nr:hypothetical protein CYMTET_34332 [Cymbomonas tetramitiformis]
MRALAYLSEEIVTLSCAACLRWKDFIEGRWPPDKCWPRYEVLTCEHVAALAEYLMERCVTYELTEMVVLEVGAGDGRLAGALQAALDELYSRAPESGPKVVLIATDNGTLGRAEGSTCGHLVQTLGFDEALVKYTPDVVSFVIGPSAHLSSAFSVRCRFSMPRRPAVRASGPAALRNQCVLPPDVGFGMLDATRL